VNCQVKRRVPNRGMQRNLLQAADAYKLLQIGSFPNEQRNFVIIRYFNQSRGMIEITLSPHGGSTTRKIQGRPLPRQFEPRHHLELLYICTNRDATAEIENSVLAKC
jgi:hypothetical protein